MSSTLCVFHSAGSQPSGASGGPNSKLILAWSTRTARSYGGWFACRVGFGPTYLGL